MAPSTTKSIDAELLKHVKRPELDKKGRPVVEEKKRRRKGETIVEEVPVLRDVTPEEVIDFRIDADARRIGVVTDDGRKFWGDLPKGWQPPEEQTSAPPADAGKAKTNGDGK